jgi:5-methylthioadenosine/S-adenosylhomocysteine deaminase
LYPLLAEPPALVDLLITGGTVVTVDPADRVLTADIAIHEKRIVAIGKDLNILAARVLDARDAAVIPGFVNAHMHETLDRGVGEDMAFFEWLHSYALPKDRAYEPRHMYVAAMLNQAEMIAGGTTSFIDIFRHPDQAATVAEMSGLRATFSPQIIDDPVGPGETLDDATEFVAAWHQRVPDRIRAWFGPHSLYSVKASTFGEIRKLTQIYGGGIHTHLAESVAETALVADRSKGLSPTQYLDELVGLGPDVVAAHCIELSAADLQLLVSRQVGIAHCPTSNAKLGNRRARVSEMLQAGAVVGLGTDSNMTNNDLDMFEEMRMAALVQKQLTGDPTVLSSAQMLRMATMGSAQVLGLSQVVGSLEVGKLADLAVVDLRGVHARPILRYGRTNVVEQLVWACSGRDVRHTVVDGSVLMEDRQMLTLNVEEIVELADRELLHLLDSAGVLESRFGLHPD